MGKCDRVCSNQYSDVVRPHSSSKLHLTGDPASSSAGQSPWTCLAGELRAVLPDLGPANRSISAMKTDLQFNLCREAKSKPYLLLSGAQVMPEQEPWPENLGSHEAHSTYTCSGAKTEIPASSLPTCRVEPVDLLGLMPSWLWKQICSPVQLLNIVSSSMQPGSLTRDSPQLKSLWLHLSRKLSQQPIQLLLRSCTSRGPVS